MTQPVAPPTAGVRRRWDQGLRPYTLTVSVLGALAVLASTPSLVQDPPEPWRVVAAVALFSLAGLPLVERRIGHSIEAYTFDEVFVLLGLVLVPGPALVVLYALTMLPVRLACRMSLQKAAFNAGAGAVGVGLAVAVQGLLGGSAAWQELPGSDLVGLVLAAAAYYVWIGASVAGALARAQDIEFRSVFRPGLPLRTAVAVSNIAVGLFVAVVGEWSPTALLGLPPVLVVLYFLYRGYLRAKEERDVWQQLEAATRELNVLEESAIVAAALRRAQQLFKSDSVELTLLRDGGSHRRFCLDGRGAITSEETVGAATSPDSTNAVSIDGDDASVLTCLVSPLVGPRGRVGVLRLVFGGPVRFSARERQVLSTFSHAVSTTLLNAALHTGVREEAERQAYQASHDHLTGLGNRSLLSSRTSAAIQAGTGTTALLLLDLDHFKEINDTLGHAAGDVLLQAIGSRLQEFAGPGRLVARLGGDEFAILLTGLSGPGEAEPVADRVLRLLSEPVVFEDLRLSVEGSLGVACHPQDADEPNELFRRADVAMYQAKSSRASWLRYDAKRDDSSVHRQALVAELRTAIDAAQLVVHYQPQVDLVTGTTIGAEALCRWRHPSRGLLLPADFISAAEHSGLVRPFTLCVLEQAIGDCATWQSPGRPLSLAVNVSARSLLDRQLPEDVAQLLDRHRLAPQRLVLEITETIATSEFEIVEDVLSRLRRLGIEISVDDFGTGFSSLAFLQRTAVHELKVDRSFVGGMLDSVNDLALVRATVHLAHSLGARAVAEGVDDRALAVALREMGCDVAQGYWFSPAVPSAEAYALMASRLPYDMTTSALVPHPRDDPEDRHLRVVATGAGARVRREAGGRR